MIGGTVYRQTGTKTIGSGGDGNINREKEG